MFLNIYVQKSGRYFSIDNFSVKINSDLHSLVWVKCSCPHVPFQSRFVIQKQICYAKLYKIVHKYSKKYSVHKKVPSRGDPSVCPAEEIKLKDGQEKLRKSKVNLQMSCYTFHFFTFGEKSMFVHNRQTYFGHDEHDWWDNFKRSNDTAKIKTCICCLETDCCFNIWYRRESRAILHLSDTPPTLKPK